MQLVRKPPGQPDRAGLSNLANRAQLLLIALASVPRLHSPEDCRGVRIVANLLRTLIL
jgi:hypothetical protein